MFVKSPKTAILMACIFIAPVIVIAFVVGQARYASLEPAERNPNVVNGFAGLGPALVALAILLISLAIAAAVIYRLDESHYGRQGALRWALMGILYGLLQQVVLTPVASDFDFQPGSILKQIGGDLLWKLVTLVLSYLLVFPVFTFALNRLRRGREAADRRAG